MERRLKKFWHAVLVEETMQYVKSKQRGLYIYKPLFVGFIDYSGNLTIPCVWKIDRAFGYMGIFSQDRAFVMQNDSSILDELVLENYHYYDNYINAGSEMTVTPCESRNGIIRYPSIRGNLYYIISKDGTIIKEFKNSNLIPHFNPFRQGLSVILWTRVEDGEDPFVQNKQ